MGAMDEVSLKDSFLWQVGVHVMQQSICNRYISDVIRPCMLMSSVYASWQPLVQHEHALEFQLQTQLVRFKAAASICTIAPKA